MIHPNNHADRLRIEKKKNEKKIQPKDKASSLWRVKRERDKEQESEDELKGYL